MDVATVSETVDVIDHAICKNKFTQHVVVNVAKLVNMQNDIVLSNSIRECDIINIDGNADLIRDGVANLDPNDSMYFSASVPMLLTMTLMMRM